MRHDENEQQAFGKSGVKIQGGLLYLGFLLLSTLGILLYAGDVI